MAVSLALACPAVHAQSAVLPLPVAQAQPKPKPEKLSDWLAHQQPSENAYPLGLSWRVPGEAGAQNVLKLDLLAALVGAGKRLTVDHNAAMRLSGWLQTLPVTGRVRVASAEARWLQANPQRDPILLTGHTVVLPERPRTVTVITGDGNRCQVLHRAGYEARAYVAKCQPGGLPAPDWAWIAQPDGLVQRASLSTWNASPQDEPAPGAWIWAPSRNSGWSDRFSEQLIRFLATQGPAPDSPQPPPLSHIAKEEDSAASAAGAASPGLTLARDLGVRHAEDERRPPDNPRPEPLALRSDEATSRSRALHVSSSDWGDIGLLQTATARMRPAGAYSMTYSRSQPYSRGNVFFQPFDWMEAGFRYTDVSNRLYGPVDFSGTQSYKDKSIDIKFRLWPESAYVPQIAVGLRDIGGTGLFSGEYVVANKRTSDFDWSLGLGWGYVGGRGNLRNPLSVFGEAFDTRQASTGPGGQFSPKNYFRGPVAMFGGVQYQTPWERLIIKAEYEGNNYQNESQNNNQRQSSPVNIGLVYRAANWADLTVGVQRGNTLMFSVSLHSQLNRLTQPKILDPAPIPVAAARPVNAPDWSLTTRDLEQQTFWRVGSVEQRDNEVRVVIDDATATYWRSRVDRIAAVLHRDAPADVDRFSITYRNRGMEVAEHVVDREAWVSPRTQPVPPAEQREAIIAQAPRDKPGTVIATSSRPAFEHGLDLHFDYAFGMPDVPFLYRLSVTESAKLRLRQDTWLQGTLSLGLHDNYDKFRLSFPSALPQVRTLVREYVTTSRLNLPNLQLTHVGKFGTDHFYSVYAGYLESMFGGVGAEWLYRPFASRFAFGVDANAVRQRDFDQHFGFRDYTVQTGHATLYWDTGWEDVQVMLSAGRYLARDVGATLNVQRVFKNGVSMGAWATRTNVSADQFGEGSFDKGIFMRIPFDTIFPRSTGTAGNFVWRPILRDGGAMLGRAVQLYGLTGLRSDRTLGWEAAPLPNAPRIPADHIEESVPPPRIKPVEPYTRVTPKTPATQWERPGSMREHDLVSALYKQNFRNIKVDYDPTQRVLITASNDQLHPISRAVGRVARTAVLQAPVEARGISITFMDGATQQVRYEFFDLNRLRGYFDGRVDAADLKDYVKVEWLNPAARERDPFARLNDLDPDARPRVLAALVPDTVSVSRVANDVVSAADTATKVDWLGAGAVGAGLVLASSLLDNRAFRFAQDHAAARWSTQGIKIGNAIPWVGFAAAGALALDGSDPRRSRTGFAAVESGATAFFVASGLKYAVGRARPTTGQGKKEFNWLTSDDAYGSFPSRHTAVAWALATPFALEYDMPWLYGVAALTNLSRVGSRQHWLSDTVASSAIGYGLGRLFWQSGRDQGKGEPKVFFDGSGLGMLWGW